MIIDFHQHFYPDALAPRVLAQLSRASGLTPLTDGTLAGTAAKNREWGWTGACCCRWPPLPIAEP